MRIVIGGEHEIAFRLAESLMAEHQVTLVCPEGTGTRADRLDVELIEGQLQSTVALKRAHASRADLFVACSEADSRNLMACVAAKSMGARQTICFIFRRDTTEEDASGLAQHLGIDRVIRPSDLLAREILRIVAVPGALDVEVFVGGKVHLMRHVVDEGAEITRGPLREIGLPRGVVLVAARRGEESFLPKGSTHFMPGDKVTAMGSMGGVNRLLLKFLRASSHSTDSHRATVVGGGAVGLAVAEGLENAGWHVRVIEFSRERCDQISPRLQSLVLHGDGSDLNLLEEERVGDDSVLIAVTSNDEKNLLVSLLAKHLGVARIVTRADLAHNERLFEKVGVDVVRSAQGAAIRSVLRGLVRTQTDILAELEHGDARVLELTLPEDFPSTPLIDLRAPVFAIVGAILRERRVIIPRGKDPVQAGDHVLVFCTREDEAAVREYFLERFARERR